MTDTATDADRGPLNVHLHQLAYVRAVERHATLTEAARELGVSQPALSQSLAQLERRLGVRLLERDGRRRTLTEAGREVARVAAQMLGLAGELREWIEAYRGGGAGTLHVGMIDAASLYVLPAAIREYRGAFPGVRLELVVDRSAALLEALDRFELDIAFVVGPVPEAYEQREVLREPLYLYAPPGTEGAPADGDWALYPEDRQTRRMIDAGLARLGLRPRVALESDSPEVLRQMVALGLGWSVLPAEVAERGEPSLRGSRREQVADRTLLAVRRGGRPEDPRSAALLATIERTLAAGDGRAGGALDAER